MNCAWSFNGCFPVLSDTQGTWKPDAWPEIVPSISDDGTLTFITPFLSTLMPSWVKSETDVIQKLASTLTKCKCHPQDFILNLLHHLLHLDLHYQMHCDRLLQMQTIYQHITWKYDINLIKKRSKTSRWGIMTKTIPRFDQ